MPGEAQDQRNWGCVVFPCLLPCVGHAQGAAAQPCRLVLTCSPAQRIGVWGGKALGQSPKRAQEVIGSRTGTRHQNLQPPPHPWCPPSSHPTILLVPRPGARWAEAPSEAQARDNC